MPTSVATSTVLIRRGAAVLGGARGGRVVAGSVTAALVRAASSIPPVERILTRSAGTAPLPAR